MTTTITFDAVLAAATKIVADKGEDYVYSNPETGVRAGFVPGSKHMCLCLYGDPSTGDPSCIVGHIFADLHPEFFEVLAASERSQGRTWPVTEVLRAASADLGKVYGMDSPVLRNKLPRIEVAEETVRALRIAQSIQDEGGTWGTALRAMQRHAPRQTRDPAHRLAQARGGLT